MGCAALGDTALKDEAWGAGCAVRGPVRALSTGLEARVGSWRLGCSGLGAR